MLRIQTLLEYFILGLMSVVFYLLFRAFEFVTVTTQAIQDWTERQTM